MKKSSTPALKSTAIPGAMVQAEKPAVPSYPVVLSFTKPTSPGIYLYHVSPEETLRQGEHGGIAGLIEDSRLQIVPVVRRSRGLMALLRTFDARTLVEPVAVPVDQVEGLWSADLQVTISHPEYPDCYRAKDL